MAECFFEVAICDDYRLETKRKEFHAFLWLTLPIRTVNFVLVTIATLVDKIVACSHSIFGDDNNNDNDDDDCTVTIIFETCGGSHSRTHQS